MTSSNDTKILFSITYILRLLLFITSKSNLGLKRKLVDVAPHFESLKAFYHTNILACAENFHIYSHVINRLLNKHTENKKARLCWTSILSQCAMTFFPRSRRGKGGARGEEINSFSRLAFSFASRAPIVAPDGCVSLSFHRELRLNKLCKKTRDIMNLQCFVIFLSVL